MASGGRGQAGGLSNLDGRAPDGTDFANYFCTYAYLYHQVRLSFAYSTSKPRSQADLYRYVVTVLTLVLLLFLLQKDMLEDHKRTGAYYNAVIQNRRLFKDKVVLDVGTGSGILAIFSAMAGAKKVYAVEATSMAKHARTLVEHNKVCLPAESA